MNEQKNKRRDRRFLMAASLLALLPLGGAWLYTLRNETMDVIIPPAPALPKPNALDFYTKAAAQLAGKKSGKMPLSEMQKVVARNAPALRTLRQGFAYQCLVPRRKNSNSFILTPMAGHRELERQLLLESRLLMARGDWNGAMQSRLDGLKLGSDISRGGLVIDLLVGVAMEAIARSQTAEIIPHLSAIQSRAALQHLRKLNSSRVSLAQILTEEKWFGVASGQEIFADPNWRTQLIEDYIPDEKISAIQWQMLSPKQVQQSYLQFMDVYIANVGSPYRANKKPLPPVSTLSAKIADASTSIFESLQFANERNNAANALLETALALRIYQAEKKTLPKSLNELVPSILPRVPLDPFGDGKKT